MGSESIGYAISFRLVEESCHHAIRCLSCGRVAIGMGEGVIESAVNDFGRAFWGGDAFVGRRRSLGATIQGHPLDYAVNALVAILMRRPILLMLFQVRPSPHRSIENGARRPSNGDRICHVGHEGCGTARKRAIRLRLLGIE